MASLEAFRQDSDGRGSFERKTKGIGKDPNVETFWADMPYYIEIDSKSGPKTSYQN